MTRFIITFLITLILLSIGINAQNVTPRQYFFIVKKIFPDTKEISVILDEKDLPNFKDDIAKAAGQAQVKAKIYPVSDFKSIGKSVNKVEKSGTLVVVPSPVLSDKSSKLFILSKCKEKDVVVVSESKDYSDSGALLGVFPQDGAKTKVVLNLKHSQDLLAKFTPDYAKQVGISEVIQ